MSNDSIYEILDQIRNTQMHQAGQLGKIEGQIEGLAGPDGRIKSLERTDSKQWWSHALIIPLLALLHTALRKYGMDI